MLPILNTLALLFINQTKSHIIYQKLQLVPFLHKKEANELKIKQLNNKITNRKTHQKVPRVYAECINSVCRVYARSIVEV